MVRNVSLSIAALSGAVGVTIAVLGGAASPAFAGNECLTQVDDLIVAFDIPMNETPGAARPDAKPEAHMATGRAYYQPGGPAYRAHDQPTRMVDKDYDIHLPAAVPGSSDAARLDPAHLRSLTTALAAARLADARGDEAACRVHLGTAEAIAAQARPAAGTLTGPPEPDAGHR